MAKERESIGRLEDLTILMSNNSDQRRNSANDFEFDFSIIMNEGRNLKTLVLKN